jgi:hypothetical protein
VLDESGYGDKDMPTVSLKEYIMFIIHLLYLFRVSSKPTVLPLLHLESKLIDLFVILEILFQNRCECFVLCECLDDVAR